MVKLGKTVQAGRHEAVKYLVMGESLHRTAEDLLALSEPRYGNAMAIIAIHAAIAYTDALTIAFREVKSADGDHARAADVLVHALGYRASEPQLRRLRAILNTKDHVSYGGNYYTTTEAAGLLAKTRDFVAWARNVYEERPG